MNLFLHALSLGMVCLLSLTLGWYRGLLSNANGGYVLGTQNSEPIPLLSSPWLLTAASDASEKYQPIAISSVSFPKPLLQLTYNLQGLCLLPGDASAIVFDQPPGQWRYVSLSQYGRNCFDGEQTALIPFSDFKGLDLSQPMGLFHTRLWYPTAYQVEINQANIIDASFASLLPEITPTPVAVITATPQSSPIGTPLSGGFQSTPTATAIALATAVPTPIQNTPSPIPAPSPTLTPNPSTLNPVSTWSLQSVSSMKETKDRICNPRDEAFVTQWVARAKELGVTHIAVETPYDSPVCGDTLAYTRQWVDVIRASGLKVWHRHMPLAFEGIYYTPKRPSRQWLNQIATYIQSNQDLFRAGDIFTPIPEPQNGGIKGITQCAQGVCQFDSAAYFNEWLRNAILVSKLSFNIIGLENQIEVGYYGFDGFVAWGANNPDWDGILEPATVEMMGNITIDHYPEAVNDTMGNALMELNAKYPSIPIIIGEWGSIGSTGQTAIDQINTTMGAAAAHPQVKGFNYWHMGVGGKEELIDEQFNPNERYGAVQEWFRR